jgi:GAF domain-containing protein
VPPGRATKAGGWKTEQRRIGERDADDPGEPELRLGHAELVRAQAAIDDLSKTHQFHHCALFLWDPTIRRLRLAAQHWGAGEDLGEVRVGHWTIALNGICGRAFQAGLATIVDDVENDPDYLNFPGSRTRSELAAPVLLDGRPTGVVNIESPRVGAFGPAELKVVGDWIDLIGDAVRSFYGPRR